jgi:uncharacterized protein
MKMNPSETPILNFLLILFNKLRSYRFPLGVEDYMLVIQALEGGFGVGDRETLKRLCRTLWAKSEQEAYLLNQLFDEVLTQTQAHVSQSSSKEVTKFTEQTPVKSEVRIEPETTVGSSVSKTFDRQPLEDLPTEPQKPVTKSSPPAGVIKEIEPEQIIQAIRSDRSSNFEIFNTTNLSGQYLPITSREIRQQWRFLRQPVREGKLEELDIAATVEKNCRYGILSEPVMMPSYTNQVKLVLLIDRGGSMVPFHHLSSQLIDKAKRGGNIKQVSVYYFQNYPEKYLYSDSTRLKAQLITDVLESIDNKTSVLIISDAGAARGNDNPERVEYTQKFIEQLQRSVNYYAWLNPMPNDSWKYTTAGKIARSVPMFEMSREGFRAAINTLRGRGVYRDRPNQWILS